MKRSAALVLFALLATACTGLGGTGARGPQRTRTVDQSAQPDPAAQRDVELGQR